MPAKDVSLRINKKNKAGFTLIEILVVIAVIAIVTSLTILSTSDFSRSTSLKQTASQVSSVITDAKTRALSQVKPENCSTKTLDGYSVDFCPQDDITCTNKNTYTLSAICSGAKQGVQTKKLPAGIQVISTGTTSKSYTFPVLTGGVKGAGKVVLSGLGITTTITVSSKGEISID